MLHGMESIKKRNPSSPQPVTYSEYHTDFEAIITSLQAQRLNIRRKLFAENNSQTIEAGELALADQDAEM